MAHEFRRLTNPLSYLPFDRQTLNLTKPKTNPCLNFPQTIAWHISGSRPVDRGRKQPKTEQQHCKKPRQDVLP